MLNPDAQTRAAGELTSFTDLQRSPKERKAHQTMLRLATQVYAQCREGIMVLDAHRRFVMVNRAFTDISGYSEAEVLGRTTKVLAAGRQERSAYRAVWETIARTGFWQGQLWQRRKDGTEYAEWLTVNAIHDPDGTVRNYVGTFSDISEQVAARDRINLLSYFDTLTNLPNRALFMDRLGLELKRAQRSNHKVAVLLLDLDHFKEVNDALGHDQGDQLLALASHRLCACVRDVDTVARLGGDEFAVILGELEDLRPAETIAQHILAALAAPFELTSGASYATASIGIALYPDDVEDIECLLKSADQAMYAAKAGGRNGYRLFTPELEDRARNRMWLANELRIALAKGQFWLAYQPIVDLNTGSVHKAEALIRWQHPARGLINPADFIPVAESSGLIVDIGEWVFRTAVKQVEQWRKLHHSEFQVSVNKSPVQFHRQSENAETWSMHLQSRGLSCQSIVVEITEGLLLEASARVDDQLRLLRAAGVQVSLDDFGTGYSSLAYLQKHDIDYVKIDQSFVRNLVAGSKELTLCEAIVAMAHKLGVRVVAEGIETAEQLALLRSAGCDYGQGYLFARPMPAREFDEFLRSNRASPAAAATAAAAY